MRVIDDIRVFGAPSDEATMDQARRCLRTDERAAAVVLCADNHLGYSVPIGGVVAYRNAVSPAGVGFDIGCGNNAVRTDLAAADLGIVMPERFDADAPVRFRGTDFARLMDRIFAEVHFGIGSTSRLGADHPIFDDDRWGVRREVRDLARLAREQIGSVGSGNHYVDVFVDEAGAVWVGDHFGSRGFGHKTATGFLNLAHGRPWGTPSRGEHLSRPPVVVGLDSDVGQDYWTAMQLAADYALAGRDLVLGQVLDILGARGLEWVRNNHNAAWLERHDMGRGPEELVVVRKGATPAFPGQLGFVGGSMGDNAAIVRGVDTALAHAGLRSTVHGAGRVMSRTQAAGRKNWKTGQRSGGRISRAMMLEWVGRKGVELRGAGTDEAPQCYKRLDEVLEAHAGAVEVVHTLRPVGVAMAGEDVVDPYKD
jgi:tRNA-splicing ligase RtcB